MTDLITHTVTIKLFEKHMQSIYKLNQNKKMVQLPIRLVPSQYVRFDLILWYVAKTIPTLYELRPNQEGYIRSMFFTQHILLIYPSWFGS